VTDDVGTLRVSTGCGARLRPGSDIMVSYGLSIRDFARSTELCLWFVLRVLRGCATVSECLCANWASLQRSAIQISDYAPLC
jgi:hypothetical protein